MNVFKYLTPLFITPFLTFSQSALAQDIKPKSTQELALLVKPAVVRIWNPCIGIFSKEFTNGKTITQEFNLSFLGTGFFINPEGYIVTSANLITSKEKCLDRLSTNIHKALINNYGKNIEEEEIKERLKYTEQYLFDDKVILPNSDIEAFPIRIMSKGNNSGDVTKQIGEDVAILKVAVNHAPTLEIGDSSKVNVQEKVVTVGYPTNTEVELGETFSDKSLYEASVQEGEIASTTKRLKGGYPVLQVDIQAKKGSAGSPIINRQGQVVGMLVSRQHDGKMKNNIPIAVTTSTLRVFINTSADDNIFRHTTNLMYKEGVKLFFEKKYKEAKKLFLDVEDNYKIEGVSAHSEVQDLIDKIERIEADRWAKPWTNPTYIFAFALLIGGGIVGTVAYFLLKQRPQMAGVTAGSSRSSTGYNSAYTSSTSAHRSNGKGKKCFLEMEYKGQIQRFQLDRSERRLGRDPNWSDFDIPSTWEVISRRHAIFKKEGDDYRLYDGDGSNPSRNGIWLSDDLRIDQRKGYLLKNGERFRIGQDAHEQVLLTYFNPNNTQAQPRTTMAN